MEKRVREKVRASEREKARKILATPSLAQPVEDSTKRGRSSTVTGSSARGSASPVKKMRLGAASESTPGATTSSATLLDAHKCDWCKSSNITCIPRLGRRVSGKNPACEACHSRKTKCENPPGELSVFKCPYILTESTDSPPRCRARSSDGGVYHQTPPRVSVSASYHPSAHSSLSSSGTYLFSWPPDGGHC